MMVTKLQFEEKRPLRILEEWAGDKYNQKEFSKELHFSWLTDHGK